MATPRREIKSRNSAWAQALASFVATKTDITPNQISIFSVWCGAFAFAAYAGYVYLPAKWHVLLPLFAIMGIQGRLICNLIDGMVAVEGGKKSAVGDIYNEFPDRLSDTLILVGAGVAGGSCESVCLGFAAALFAMFTAYARVLGGAIGATQRFLGPMAKQHRMALLTGATALCFLTPVWPNLNRWVFPLTLLLISVGSLFTVYRRVCYMARELREKKQ